MGAKLFDGLPTDCFFAKIKGGSAGWTRAVAIFDAG
jgi:hypothetical protein